MGVYKECLQRCHQQVSSRLKHICLMGKLGETPVVFHRVPCQKPWFSSGSCKHTRRCASSLVCVTGIVSVKRFPLRQQQPHRDFKQKSDQMVLLKSSKIPTYLCCRLKEKVTESPPHTKRWKPRALDFPFSPSQVTAALLHKSFLTSRP